MAFRRGLKYLYELSEPWYLGNTEDLFERHIKYVWYKIVPSYFPGVWPANREGESPELIGVREVAPGEIVLPAHLHRPITHALKRKYRKVFQAEDKESIFMLLDFSASMRLGHKFERMVAIAALFAFSSRKFMDNAYVYVFNEKNTIHRFTPGMVRGYRSFVDKLRGLDLEQDRNRNERLSLDSVNVISRLVRATRKGGGIIIMVSDFFDIDNWRGAISRMSATAAFIPVVIRTEAEENGLSGIFPVAAVDPEKRISYMLRSWESLLGGVLNRSKRRSEEKHTSELVEILNKITDSEPFFFRKNTTVNEVAEYFFEQKRKAQR